MRLPGNHSASSLVAVQDPDATFMRQPPWTPVQDTGLAASRGTRSKCNIARDRRSQVARGVVADESGAAVAYAGRFLFEKNHPVPTCNTG